MKACPFCRSGSIADRVLAKEMSQATFEQFAYDVCAECGSIHIGEVPADIASYYAGYYSLEEDAVAAPSLKTASLRAVAPLVRFFLSGVPKAATRNPPAWTWPFVSPNLQAFLHARPWRRARILDVGCGNGDFPANLRRLGFAKAFGVDPFIDLGRLSPERRRFVQQGGIEDILGLFDFVLFNHSLEHMASPAAALTAASRVLAPRGTVVVHLPNAASPEFCRYGGDWWGLHAPRHFAIPTPEGMQRLAQTCGLRIVDVIGTARFDNYLYSREYALGIADHDPGSWRRGGSACIWTKNEVRKARRKAAEDNATATGDWVCFFLRLAGGEAPANGS
ncbi:MAG TPA: class I SAM-dependent methyltransferase [Magnetospirillum sp.]|jgi:SAM-dependent methyltransferase|nr:class I SAM-dependent methyltransferase [Magnetospirillum sp.]